VIEVGDTPVTDGAITHYSSGRPERSISAVVQLARHELDQTAQCRGIKASSAVPAENLIRAGLADAMG
jgi:hypothetical protein